MAKHKKDQSSLYSAMGNLRDMLKKTAAWDKSLLTWAAILVTVVLSPLVAINMSRYVVDAVTNNASPANFLWGLFLLLR